jgi:hypothetical protein
MLLRGGTCRQNPAPESRLYSKPPSELLFRVIFTEKLRKWALEAWLLREILAYNADRMQDASR